MVGSEENSECILPLMISRIAIDGVQDSHRGLRGSSRLLELRPDDEGKGYGPGSQSSQRGVTPS